MPPRSQPDPLKAELDHCVKVLRTTSFDSCYVIDADFTSLPSWPGIYAIKSRQDKILYIGKAANIRNRFRTGHRALVSMFIDGWQAEDARIVVIRFGSKILPYMLDIENRLLLVFRPKYNRQIPLSEVEVEMNVAREFSSVVKPSILDFLPGYIANAIKEYATANSLSTAQVVELALAQFFDVDAVTFETCNLSSPGQMQEQIAILKTKLAVYQSEPKIDYSEQ